MGTFTFFAAGEPKGQPAPRFSPRTGRAFKPKTADAFRADVERAARAAKLAGLRMAGPFRLTVTVYLPRPKDHHRAGDKLRELKPTAPHLHACKPDLTNIIKALEDALTDAGVWRDDSAISEHRTAKRYSDAAGRVGCEITITELEEEAA